jgi:hypothetical protein
VSVCVRVCENGGEASNPLYSRVSKEISMWGGDE